MKGMSSRVLNRIKREGVWPVMREVGLRVAQPVKRWLHGRHKVELRVELPPVALPCLSERDIAFVEDQIKRIAAAEDATKIRELRIAFLGNLRLSTSIPDGLRVLFVQFGTELTLLAYLAEHRHILMASEKPSDGVKKEIERVARGLGSQIYESAEALMREAALWQDHVVAGPAVLTYPTYLKLSERLREGQYGFKEALDWNVIQGLPTKFDRLAATARIRAVPMSALQRGYGRVARQLAVGELYAQPYLRVGSVLDVCCDICGIRHFVGPSTKYVGVDMQGLPDIRMNLETDEWTFAPKSSETVICFEALEHLDDIHGQFDRMMATAGRYFIGSLLAESVLVHGRFVNAFGDSRGNAQLPIAPVFDRHKWIFTFGEAMDFIDYRARRAGFRICELTLFYHDRFLGWPGRVERAFRKANLGFLSRNVVMVGFVVERANE